VLEDLERLAATESHRAQIVDEVASRYRFWRENARARLDQTAELFPEFVTATQELLARRLSLESERAEIAAQADAGALPPSMAGAMLEELERSVDALKEAPGRRISADPDDLLQKVPFFRDVPADEFARIVQKLRHRTAPSGHVIVRQGERGSSLFLLARGVVRVLHAHDGGEGPIATLMAGDFFGEMALLHGSRRAATCRAVTPCALYELARSDLDDVLASCPAMQRALEEADRFRSAELARDAESGTDG
jgi:CPA1 family monovalent cation:H+ antiporter